MSIDSNKSYVLITAAKNEEEYITKTILSGVLQSVLPQKWVIVSDGSTDSTADIVESCARKEGYIQLLRLTPKRERSFASKG